MKPLNFKELKIQEKILLIVLATWAITSYVVLLNDIGSFYPKTAIVNDSALISETKTAGTLLEAEVKEIEETQGYTPIIFLNDLKWWTAEISEHNDYANIWMQYPQFLGDSVKGLNEHIKKIITDNISNSKKYLKKIIDNSDEDCGQSYCSVDLTGTYEIYSTFNDIVSLELVFADYTGGGNGNHRWAHIVNWDLKNNKLLNPTDLFCAKKYPGELAEMVYQGLYNEFKNDIDVDIDWFKSQKNDLKKDINEKLQRSNVLLDYRDLLIVFNPYMILPGIFDIVRAPIPYSVLKGKICL